MAVAWRASSTYAVRFRFPLGCFSVSGAGRGTAASTRGGRLWGVTTGSWWWLGAETACLSGVAATKGEFVEVAMIAGGKREMEMALLERNMHP